MFKLKLKHQHGTKEEPTDLQLCVSLGSKTRHTQSRQTTLQDLGRVRAP